MINGDDEADDDANTDVDDDVHVENHQYHGDEMNLINIIDSMIMINADVDDYEENSGGDVHIWRIIRYGYDMMMINMILMTMKVIMETCEDTNTKRAIVMCYVVTDSLQVFTFLIIFYQYL